ncbi:MAG: hypothetical protein ACREBA_08480 [Nitrosotalea sp.]
MTETANEKKKGQKPEYSGWLEMEGKKYRISLWKQNTSEENHV